MDEISEIKSKIDIVKLIGDYVELRRAGVTWKARCPFHNEKTPSFIVNEERQFYYCFGCHESGDIFTFVQKKENLEFPEALKLLAQKAGVELKSVDRAAASQKTRLFDLLNETTSHWQTQLAWPAQASVREYLQRRGLDEETIKTFRIGWAPESWDDILKHLMKLGYNETEIAAAGLTVKKEKGSGYYDRFRGRVTFPIQDLFGNVVGFSARTLKKDEPAKYINTPETNIYKKGKILYGLDKAKDAIRKSGYAIVVEGNMDVIASHRVGIKNAVAVSGTALTEDQIVLLKRYTNNLAFCFDMDEAGQNAANRSIDLAMEKEMNIKIIQLISGKDPDECIQNNAEDWKESIRRSQTIMEYYFAKYFSRFDITKIEQKKELAKILLAEIRKLRNPLERDHWLKQLAGRLAVDEGILREMMPVGDEPARGVFKPKAAVPFTGEKADSADDILLSILLSQPTLIEYALLRLPLDYIADKTRPIYNDLYSWYNANNQITSEDLIEKMLGQKYLGYDDGDRRRLLLLKDTKFDDYLAEEWHHEVQRLVKRISEQFLTKRKLEIQKQIEDVNLTDDNRRTLLADYQAVSQKLNKL
jgi:DNA primase